MEFRNVKTRGTARLLLSLQLFVVFVQCIALTIAASSSSVDSDLTLTPTQKQAFDKFKQRVAGKLPHDYMKQDIYLIRWLRAKNFNVDQAENMLSEGAPLSITPPSTTPKAYIELARREAAGLPAIDPNLIPPESMDLPSEEELGDFEIII